jgi:hypothetical protein
MRIQSFAYTCGAAIATAAMLCTDVLAHPRQIDVPVNVTVALPTRTGDEVFARMLPNGYVVVVDSLAGFNHAGTVSLYRSDGTLVSTLVGKPGDRIGLGGVTALKNGNILIASPNWQCADALGQAPCGAVTWMSGTVGLNGTVDASNSLVGSSPGDTVGRFVFSLANGDYVVRGNGSQIGAGSVGTLTRGNGLTGRSGAVTSANSVVGTFANDLIGDSVQLLPNGDIVIVSESWGGARGAVTQIRAGNAFTGVIDSSNSLVGTTAGDQIGRFGDGGDGGGVIVLSNGNYVVCSPQWSRTGDPGNNAGAATWINATNPIVGTVSAANSLIGTAPEDNVCAGGVIALEGNGNYVVISPFFGRNGASTPQSAAATWGDGALGVTGAVSQSNSLIGMAGPDGSSVEAIALHGNGNYVVTFGGGVLFDGPGYDPVVWAPGTTGVRGVARMNNAQFSQLPGSAPNIVPLANGHYVVTRSRWASSAQTANQGAVTWGNGQAGGIPGPVSAANSITGAANNDGVNLSVTALTNGNFIVSAPSFSAGRGAVTWMPGYQPLPAQIGDQNSLIGPLGSEFGGFVTGLLNGNFVIGSPLYSTSPSITALGGWTWGDGQTATYGQADAANTVIGLNSNDALGNEGITPLASGGFVAPARSFGTAGAICEYGGTGAISGGPNPDYCLMGSVAGESRYWRIASDEGTNSWAVLRPSANLLSIVAADNDSIFKNGFD